MFEIAGVAVLLIAAVVILDRKFDLLYRFEDWRYGRKVDETVEWQAFTDAFKVEK